MTTWTARTPNPHHHPLGRHCSCDECVAYLDAAMVRAALAPVEAERDALLKRVEQLEREQRMGVW